MAKTKISEHSFPYPMPMVVLGTLVEGRPNFMAVGWVTRVNFKPPMIAVALGKTHYTNRGIHATGAFSVNIPASTCWRKWTTADSSPERMQTRLASSPLYPVRVPVHP